MRLILHKGNEIWKSRKVTLQEPDGSIITLGEIPEGYVCVDIKIWPPYIQVDTLVTIICICYRLEKRLGRVGKP